MIWLLTAEGGGVRADAVIALEPDMRNDGRWIVRAYVSDELQFDLLDYHRTHTAAKARCAELLRMMSDHADALAD